MNQRDTALASLWGRTYRAAVTPVHRTLFDEAALGDARQLKAATDLLTDIPAAHTLGWFHWLRYLSMPGQDATEELSAAQNLLKPVFEWNPYAVPEPVQRWYLRAEASLYAGNSGPGSAGRIGSRPEQWHGREQLPVFRAMVRSTVDAAPASQPDRTRFLLDAALMLRSIAGRGADDALLADAAELTLAALGTSQATLPPPTGIHPGAALQAFLEPVSGPVAAKSQLPSVSQGGHPYAAFSGTGYGDDGYSGSDYSMPSATGSGYDLSGIIGTSDFEAVGYDEPAYGRLSYDDPRDDDAARYQESRRPLDGARFAGPRFDETRLDNLWLPGDDVRQEAAPAGYGNDGFGEAPVRSVDHTRFDVAAFVESRIDRLRRTSTDMPAPGQRAGGAALGSRAAQGGSWVEDTSFDHFADLDLSDEPPARFLTGMLPESAPAGRRISLMVQVTLAGRPGASAPLKPMRVPPGGCHITVTVTAPGLVPVGDLEQDLHVPAASDSEPIRFGFRTGRAGLHPVLVRAFAAGTFVGELALQVSVEAGARLEEGPVRTAVLAGLVAEPGEVTLQVSRTDEDRYSFQLIGEAFYPVELTRRLAGDPAEVVRALTEELHAMAALESRYASPALVRNRIRNLGAQLWAEVVPDTIRRQFWEQAGRIKLFTVASDMDTVPWELLYPIDGGNDNGFLVEQFPVVRRVYGQSRARHLALSSAAFVVPPGSPANAMDEVEIVKARLGAAVRHREVCSRLDTLIGLLEDSPSVLHFACHNEFTNRAGSVISLDGGPLRPSDLTPARQARSMASSSPLVFLNACRTAGEVPGLMEMMGWARQFMGAGAGAFIGSLWAVRSSSAKAFADTFYHALVSEAAPLGEASLLARRAIAADAGDPTWLAYTIYGNPSATLQ
jgi:hypothetical protein